MTSCCEDPACSHAVMAAATLEASKLTDKEREIILGVLAKDEIIRRQQQLRIMRLKAELQSLRRKGALRPSGAAEGGGADAATAGGAPPAAAGAAGAAAGRACGRCRAELGRVINRGAACRACRLHVCKQCREYSHRTTDWVCAVCHKHMEIQAASGEWMNEFVRRPSRRRDHKVYVPAADIIKRTIRRSWTISNPTPRWSALRGSPEHRPYNSLPRGQDISDYPSLVRTPGARSPVRRTQSEDVYGEVEVQPTLERKLPSAPTPTSSPQTVRRQQRVNPLMALADRSPDRNRKTSPRRKQPEPTRAAAIDVDEPDRDLPVLPPAVVPPATDSNKSSPETSRRQQRVNPLVALAERSPKQSRKTSPARARTLEEKEGETDNAPPSDSAAKTRSPRTSEKPASTEKRVSFGSPGEPVKLATTRAQSMPEGGKKEKKMTTGSRSLPEESSSGLREDTVAEVHFSKDDGPVELCDIEPLSGTVFRKVTVRRRRQENMRKVAAVDTAWRRSGADGDLLDILLPDGDDYRLVFLNSDSSSKEEEPDDADSSSTASSFPIDECDWDYFEPGATAATAAAARPLPGWATSSSPFGSPGTYRRGGLLDSPLGSPLVYRRIRESSDEDTARLDSNSPSDSFFHQQEPSRNEKTAEALSCAHLEEAKRETSCRTCGASPSNFTTTHYIPIPVPVPIPFPVPTVWTAQDTLVLYGPDGRIAPRSLWQYLPPPLAAAAAAAAAAVAASASGQMPAAEEDDSDSSEGDAGRVYRVSRESDDALPASEDDDNSRDDMSSSSCEDTDSDDTGTVADKKPKKFSRVFVVNESAGSSSASDSSDEDTDTEMDCGVVLTSIRQVDSECVASEVRGETCAGSCEEEGEKTVDGGFGIVEEDKENRYADNSLKIEKNTEALDKTENVDKKSAAPEASRNQKRRRRRNKLSNGSFPDETNLQSRPEACVAEPKAANSNEIVSSNADVVDLPGNVEHIIDNDTISKINLEEAIIKNDAEEAITIESENDNQCDNQESEDQALNKPEIDSNIDRIGLETNETDEVTKEDENQSSHVDTSDEATAANQNSSTASDSLTNKSSLTETPPEHNKSSPASDITTTDAPADTTSDEAVQNVDEAAQNQPTAPETSKDEPPRDDTPSANPLTSTKTTDEAVPTRDPHGYASSPGLSDASADDATSSDDERRRAAGGGPTSAGPPGARQYGAGAHAARYTSLVMITQEPAPAPQVSIVTTDTTRVVAVPGEVVVRHTNGEDAAGGAARGGESVNSLEATGSVTIITGGETLSAFEEGLADDDSWVENLSHEEEDDDDDDDDFETNSPTDDSSSGEEVTLTCSAALDQEDELRGYHRAAIDFTLHTIVEESCEDSEVEPTSNKTRKERPASATDLEKYFFFGLGDGTVPSINSNRGEDAFSETSSIYSEGMDSLGGPEDNHQQNNDSSSDPTDLASSRLEKYFLSGFMGFTAERRDSDGSVGSDSEGKPSPEQRRKRLVRARGSGRSHSSSLDNLLANPDLADQPVENLINSEDSSSSDSDTYDESLSFEKGDGQFDTVKRKKAKKQKASEEKNLETTQEVMEERDSNDEDGHKTPQPEISAAPSNLTTNKNQQSRDSGFIGSCDDLLKEQRENGTPELGVGKGEVKVELEKIEEKREEKVAAYTGPPATSLTRKDSFNNWSSDEETNLMMCKMRQFFKTMVANSQCASKPTTPNLNARLSPKPQPSPRSRNRLKPPQLLYFEDQLTKLMKTVPGIRDDQVREIVEYLSSEDTWSDSYDSSDYTSSDLEGTTNKSALQQQISDSCQEIISKFDKNVEDEEGDEGDGGIVEEGQGINKETAFVYQKLVASIEKMAAGDLENKIAPHNSPPLIAKVMHHIGSRLVALMHEVSSGESHASNSPKARHYHRRLQQKLSNASTTTTDDDSTSDSNFAEVVEDIPNAKPSGLLPRSRSHDLLLSEAKALHQSSSGVSDIAEERGEASDCERFSWRGSFESALLASDSRNRLSLIEVTTASTTAAKRRSAGDLLFAPRSASREQLDRVRSCGSIGESGPWSARRRSSVPDCGSGGSADGEDEDEDAEARATLPRGLQAGGAPTTNSLPRLPTGGGSGGAAAMQKAQSMHHFLPQAKSARYRPPGFSRLVAVAAGPKRAVSAPGLQPVQRRGRRSQQMGVQGDDASAISEAAAHSRSSPTLAAARASKSATPSPAPASRRGAPGAASAAEWHAGDDDVDRLVAMHHNRSSLSSLGLRSDSMASVYSGAGDGRYGSVAVRGQVEFGLQYNYKAGALEILVRKCRDLAPVDVKRNRSDPYVKVYLLPDKSKSGKRKTKVKKHTLSPVFDECLRFHISLNELETRTLWLTVWHSDMFGRNDFLGEVTMALENKVFDDPTPKLYSLQERTEPFDDILSFKGDIIVCLKFVPPDMTAPKKGKRSRGMLHVLVKEAKALTAVKAQGHSDPFCKSYLLPDKGRSSKQKTLVVKRTVNPHWNHTFVYDDVTLQELAERCLELTVWDHDRLASNEFLGGVRFSLGSGKHYGKPVDWMDASGKEQSLWKSMLERPNFWVEGCVSLRATLDTRAS